MSDTAIKKEEPSWNYFHEFCNTVEGGKICIAPGKFVNSNGESLDPADALPRLKAEKARIERQMADAERDLAAAEVKAATFPGKEEGATK